MKRLLTRRPSPALVVACIALFVSLSGVSYGLATGLIDTREIRNNTIRTQDLRNNNIRAIDIRNSTIRGRDVALNTLTGGDVNEAKLGQVPSAARADDAARLGGVGPEGFLRSGPPGFTGLSLQGDWTTIGGQRAPGYAKDGLGFVHLHGALRGTDGTVAFVLPAGARPATTKRFPVYSQANGGAPAVAGLIIEPSGAATLRGAEVHVLVSLDGVSFRAGD